MSNLTPLKGMPIEQLYLANCRSVKDISALDGMPLQTLTLNHTGISDLKPLIHSPLRELNRAVYMDERRRARGERFTQVANDFTVLAEVLASIPLDGLEPFQTAAE